MKSKSIKDVLTSTEMINVYIIVALSMVIGSINSNFLSVATVITLSRAIMVTMIFALGEMLVIVSGGIDVSFPAVACAALFVPIKLHSLDPRRSPTCLRLLMPSPRSSCLPTLLLPELHTP